MITVILKDGTEVPIGDPCLPALVSSNGKHDKMVSIFRRSTREWTLGFMSTLGKGDFFRWLDQPESAETVYLVTKGARIHHHPGRTFRDPDIYLEGVNVSTLSALPPVAQSRIVLATTGKPLLQTSHTRLLLE